MDREDAQRYAQDDAGQKTEKIVRDTKTMIRGIKPYLKSLLVLLSTLG